LTRDHLPAHRVFTVSLTHVCACSRQVRVRLWLWLPLVRGVHGYGGAPGDRWYWRLKEPCSLGKGLLPTSHRQRALSQCPGLPHPRDGLVGKGCPCASLGLRKRRRDCSGQSFRGSMLLDEASCRTTSTPRSSFGPVIDSLKASNTQAERMYIT
jgi:hypothetical protein